MPKHYGRKTAVQLSVADIAKAITQNPRSKQCLETSNSAASIESEFLNSSEHRTLAENAFNDHDGRHLWFLGKAKDIPFLMVHAGEYFFDPDCIEKRTRRPAKTIEQQQADNVSIYDHDANQIDKSTSRCGHFFRQTDLNIVTDLSQLKYQIAGQKPDYSPSNVPHALCLTVFLTKASFSYTTYEKKTLKTTTNDIKIDVYFNGQFVESQLITYRKFSSSGSEGMKGRVVRFKGQRLNRMIEKPWIFVPLGQSADDIANINDSPDQNQCPDANIRSRWTAISDALRAEVNEFDNGKHTVTGDCLTSLASLNMPSQLQDAENANGASARFGIIDVLVIYGTGNKDGPGCKYVARPTRCRAGPFHVNVGGESNSSSGHPRNENTSASEFEANLPTAVATGPCPAGRQQPNEVGLTSEPQLDRAVIGTPGPSASNQMIPSSETLASKLAVVTETPAEAPATRLTHNGSNDEPHKLTTNIINELFPPNRSRPATPKGSSDSSMAFQSSNAPRKRSSQSTSSGSWASAPKRARTTSLPSQSSNPVKKRASRMLYHHVVDTKQTLSEELQSIAEDAIEFAPERRTRKMVADSELLSSVSESPERVSLVEVPRASKVVTLKMSPEKLSSIKLGSNPGKQLQSECLGVRNASGTSATFDASAPQAISTVGKTPHAPSRRNRTSQLTLQSQVFDADFEVPDLSKNCCITYAGPGVVRNVPAVRGGWFKEEGVVMATRFIVG